VTLTLTVTRHVSDVTSSGLDWLLSTVMTSQLNTTRHQNVVDNGRLTKLIFPRHVHLSIFSYAVYLSIPVRSLA